MLTLLRVVASVALVFAMGQVVAAPQAVPHPCAAITDAGERLACYDTAFPPVVGAIDLASERERGLREFGLNKAQLRDRDPDRMVVVAPDRIEAHVARMSERANGQRIITLDSGQVWLLTEVTMKGPLRIGDRVVVREAALGSFMLMTPKNIALRARRIQ